MFGRKKKKTEAAAPVQGFASVLSDKRIPVPTPDSIIDENGKPVLGTFDKEFQHLNFLDIHNQSILPDFTNKNRITLWEACEINLDEDLAILVAFSKLAGVIGICLTLVYDKKAKKKYAWMSPASGNMSETLLDGSTTAGKGPLNNVTMVNDFNHGKARVQSHGRGPAGKMELDFDLTRWSVPSVVSIPMDAHKTLYTQKDLFTVEGYIVFNGKKYLATEASMAIIDDHRGYYPFDSHYDWVTTMGYGLVNGEKRKFGFNLTRNQSTNQDDYNENILWLDGKSSRITPVKFEHLTYDYWRITDDYGMVDLTYDIGDRNLLKFTIGHIKADYSITFGELKGYVCDEDGTKYVVDGMCGIGEDKSLRI